MRIEFDGRLYTRKAVEAAAEDFREHARFRIEEKSGRILVSADLISDEIEGFFEDEFSNYVLAKLG